MRLARLIEYKRTLMLAVLLLFSALLYVLNGVQSRAVQGLREVILDVYSPALRGSEWLQRQVATPFAAIFSYDELKRENETLKLQVARLQMRYEALSEAHQTLRRLAQWDFGDLGSGEAQAGTQHCIPARVIGLHRGSMAQTAILDKGRADGVLSSAPVLAPEGLVGIVRQSADHASTVQLLSDPNCSIGVELEGTRDKGLVRGTGNGGALECLLESPSSLPRRLRPASQFGPALPSGRAGQSGQAERIGEGQRIKTAGVTGSVYPAGLLVGSIAGVRRDKFGNTIADVEPAADLSTLDAVLVLVGSPASASASPTLSGAGGSEATGEAGDARQSGAPVSQPAGDGAL